MFKLGGVNPALVTPFTDDGRSVDEERLRSLIRHLIDQGVTGLVPCGSTGEFQNLTEEERRRVIEVTIDEANGRVPVIAGTGSSGTKLTIEQTKHAKDAGADAAIIVTPYYHKPSNRGLYEHYRLIAEAVDIPIVLYNIPQATGVSLPWQLVEDLVEIPNIVGLKDSSGELRFILAVLEKVGERLSVVCGHDEVVLPALAAGCSGMILASANVFPDYHLKLLKAVQEGRLSEARQIQLTIQKMSRIIVKSGAVATKAALNMMGINVGPVRLPLSVGGELTYEERDELRLDLEKIGKAKRRVVEVETPTAKPLAERFSGIGIRPEEIQKLALGIGEALAGDEPDAAHTDLLVGKKDGPVGEAFARAKASPALGHEPLLAILEPNLAVKPPTLLVPTVSIKGMRDASLVYGPAQAGAAKAVVDSVADGTIPKAAVNDIVIIANIFVHPAAVDRKRVYINNYKAMRHAIRRAAEGWPSTDELIENKERAKHPFKYTP
ncbi:MAG: 4-hydroxy-tetrahydrodipicolinate synthase [Candidatus Bathyarchaeia archaeon]